MQAVVLWAGHGRSEAGLETAKHVLCVVSWVRCHNIPSAAPDSSQFCQARHCMRFRGPQGLPPPPKGWDWGLLQCTHGRWHIGACLIYSTNGPKV